MINIRPIFLIVVLGLSFSVKAEKSPQKWYQDGEAAVLAAQQLRPNFRRAKNVILFVGDGMGVSTVTAARILQGQRNGLSGEENQLSFEKFPYLALSKTYNSNQQTPDSAGTMSAMMTGVKTKAGVLSVNQSVMKGDCGSAKGQSVETFLEQAELAGMSTGVVTTDRVTQATPAATYAHLPHRGWDYDLKLPKEAVDNGCRDIARQLIEFSYGDGIEVVMGGGRSHFLPNTMQDPEYSHISGRRGDGRDLVREWLSRDKQAIFAWNKAQFDQLDTESVSSFLGLFEPYKMKYNHDRQAGEPSLSEMTAKAIDILNNNQNGYFLMVESGRIDHAHHAGNAFRALDDTIELSNAVEMALSKVDLLDTLIIVTADHSHVMTISGYAARGNHILGKVANQSGKLAIASDGKPYTSIGYLNGRGTEVAGKRMAGRGQNLAEVDTHHPDYYQEALVPLHAETHGAEDVAIYAIGAQANLVHGVQEQNVIYHIMKKASGIQKRIKQKVANKNAPASLSR